MPDCLTQSKQLVKILLIRKEKNYTLEENIKTKNKIKRLSNDDRLKILGDCKQQIKYLFVTVISFYDTSTGNDNETCLSPWDNIASNLNVS